VAIEFPSPSSRPSPLGRRGSFVARAVNRSFENFIQRFGICEEVGKTLSSLRVVRSGRHFYTARMKIKTTLLKGTAIFATAALCALGQTARAADEPTGLSLIKDANEYVGKDVKDKVIGLRSEKSVASLTPNIWYVVFYDHDATFKTAEVKFEAGKKSDLKHPMRAPFAYVNDKNLLDQKVIKIDSDKAIKIATAEPLLSKLTIRSTQLWLENVENVPTWRVRLWAQKLRHPNDDANIGEVSISAEDGKVLKTDLHIDRVD
jgi:hypothetical protein